MLKNKSSVRPYSDEEYALLVLYDLRRACRRPNSWITDIIRPRDIMNDDSASSREVQDALDIAISAIRAQFERADEE
jgi:hypothetical protein